MGHFAPRSHQWDVVSDLTIGTAVPASTLAQAASGDADALSRIVAAHHLDLIRIAQLICRDASLGEEAAQAAWSVAWRKLGTVRDPDRLRPWLMAIAANEARQLLRRRRARPVVEIPAEVVAAHAADPQSRSDLIDLSTALGRLDPDDRALLALRFVAGFDATEIGRALGISGSGVRSRLSRLLGQLRAELRDD
jgi:RNA polymerase sigma-70 factor (ECF subfamily)